MTFKAILQALEGGRGAKIYRCHTKF